MSWAALVVSLCVYVLQLIQSVTCAESVYLSLSSSSIFTNNTEILITDIGEDLSLPSLTCHTDQMDCCRAVDTGNGAMGEWYYPDGRLVSNQTAGEDFYRLRDAPQVVRLARREATNPGNPNGLYCCVIPTTRGEMTFCANLVDCQSLPALSNGTISYSDESLAINTIATYTCDSGYNLVGASTRTCSSNDTWSGPMIAQICDAVDCGTPPTVLNGTFDTPSTRFGDTVSYSCDSGFEITGLRIVTCMANGNWSPPPTCTDTCSFLPGVDMATIDYVPFPSRDPLENTVAIYECITGYYPVGGDVMRTCTRDGTWTGFEPQCIRLCTDLPIIANGAIAYDPNSFPRLENNLAMYSCDPGYELNGVTTRMCGRDGIWTLSEPTCDSPLKDELTQTVTEDNYINITSTVSSFADLTSNNTLLQTSDLLTDISQVFVNVANFFNGSTNITINNTVVRDMVTTLNSLLQWNSEVLVVDSTTRVVQSFETVASQFAQQNNFTIEFTDTAFVTEVGVTEVFQRSGIMANFSLQAEIPASISLPPMLFNEVPDDRTLIGVFFALYETPTLFPVGVVEDNSTTRETVVGSPVIAATVGVGIDFSDLGPQAEVLITLGLRPIPENFTVRRGSEKCVSWDFSSDSWVTTGCRTERVEDTIECRCDHLTNFAVLIDICSRAQDCANEPVADSILSVITYIGVVISCIGLIFTVITLLAFKELRERDNSKYHIQLALAIFCMLIIFAAGIEQVQVYAGCVIVSILIHYFSLVAVMWMGAEALLMFQKLVIIFVEITQTFIIIVSLICWLVPLIPVLIPMIIDLADGTSPDTDLIVTRNYHNTTGDTSGFCFIKHPGVFFGAFLAPIFVIILYNLVMFIWVIVVLLRHHKGQLERTQQSINPKMVVRLMISISGVMFLFGLTWLFAAFTFTIAGNNLVRITFQALFVVCASFQGFFIFLFFCVFNKEARVSWGEVFSLCKRKSKFLHLSQYKNTGSSSATHTQQNKAHTRTTNLPTTLGRATYGSGSLQKCARSPSEKVDFLKEDKNSTAIILTETNRESSQTTSTFNGTPNILAIESQCDSQRDVANREDEHKLSIEQTPVQVHIIDDSTEKVCERDNNTAAYFKSEVELTRL